MIANNFDKTLLTRILSSIVLVGLALFTNFLGGYFFLISIILVFFILLKEYYNLFSFKILSIKFIFSCFFSVINFFLIYYGFYLLIIYSVLINLLVISLIVKKKWLYSIFPLVYLSVPLYILIYLNNIEANGKLIILWAFIIVWSSDITAFLFGKLLKGPKFVPKISPNKTWSGFIISILFSVFASLLFTYYFFITNLFYSALVGLLVGLACSLGDLFESWLKRINTKKDTSNLIPGHGGLLDRLDGFLFGIIMIFIMTLIRS